MTALRRRYRKVVRSKRCQFQEKIVSLKAGGFPGNIPIWGQSESGETRVPFDEIYQSRKCTQTKNLDLNPDSASKELR